MLTGLTCFLVFQSLGNDFGVQTDESGDYFIVLGLAFDERGPDYYRTGV